MEELKYKIFEVVLECLVRGSMRGLSTAAIYMIIAVITLTWDLSYVMASLVSYYSLLLNGSVLFKHATVQSLQETLH